MTSEINSIYYNFSLLLNKVSFFYKFFTCKEAKTEKERKIFTNIWYKTWIEEGYAKPDESVIEKKKKYEKVSRDFLIKFLFIPVGTIRIIYNNKDVGLPIINNFEIFQKFTNEKIIELSLFAIRKFFRFSHISSLISMKKIYKFLKKEGIPGFFAAIDYRLFSFLKEKLQIPLHKIGKEKIYEGSLTFPVYLNLKEGEEFLKQRNFQMFKFFTSP